MREILFRGRTKDGKWCYGDYVHAIRFNGVRGFHKDWIIPGVYGNGGWISMRGKDAVDGDTVGQYTGHKDKNGKMIFEGDICHFYDGDSYSGCYELNHIHEIKICHESLWYIEEAEYVEVIGNIYDNPELLEEESDYER